MVPSGCFMRSAISVCDSLRNRPAHRLALVFIELVIALRMTRALSVLKGRAPYRRRAKVLAGVELIEFRCMREPADRIWVDGAITGDGQ